MTLRHGFHNLPGGGEHVVVADARQNAAVDVEHVLARQGIDIGDVLFVARRDERAARGLEQRIDLSGFHHLVSRVDTSGNAVEFHHSYGCV